MKFYFYYNFLSTASLFVQSYYTLNTPIVSIYWQSSDGDDTNNISFVSHANQTPITSIDRRATLICTKSEKKKKNQKSSDVCSSDTRFVRRPKRNELARNRYCRRFGVDYKWLSTTPMKGRERETAARRKRRKQIHYVLTSSDIECASIRRKFC